MKPTKVQSLGIYLLQSYGKQIGTIELNKLFYLIDSAFYRLFGRTVSDLSYIRYDKGPYTRQIADSLIELIDYEVTREYKPSRGYSKFLKVAWCKGNNPRFEPEMEAEEKEVVNQVLRKVGGLNPWDLERLAYKTEPMQEIIERERKLGYLLLGEPVDFQKLQRNSFMQEYLENLRRPISSEDNEHKEFLQKEWAEFDSILEKE